MKMQRSIFFNKTNESGSLKNDIKHFQNQYTTIRKKKLYLTHYIYVLVSNRICTWNLYGIWN